MSLGNPAEKLHRILSAFDESSSSSLSVQDCWQKVFDCGEVDLPKCLAEALALVPAIQTRVDTQGPIHQAHVVERYAGAWLRPLIVRDRGWDNHSAGLVDTDSLLALTSLSVIFGTMEPPVLVNAEKSSRLLGLINEARSAVQDESDLPPRLRVAILSRLHDIQWAVEHFNVVGPDGLLAALDRLGAELIRSGRKGAWRKKTGTALLFGWLIFSNLDDVVSGIDAAQDLASEVASWTHDAAKLTAPERPQLEAPNRSDEYGDDVVDAEIVEDD